MRDTPSDADESTQLTHDDEDGVAYERHLVPTHAHPHGSADSESNMTFLLKPTAEDTCFRSKVKLSCNQRNEVSSEPQVARKSLATVHGKHPHQARVNIRGTHAAVRSELILETDSLSTALCVEFHDLRHKVQLCLDIRVFLGEASIRQNEAREQHIDNREGEREEMLELWRRNEEVRIERHAKLLAREAVREAEVAEMHEEQEKMRLRERERELKLQELIARDAQREEDRDRERELERVHEKVRVAEREQIRIRDQERSQERAKEKARERERQEEIATREVESAQLAMERQLREEERQLEKERELQRKFELLHEKERDVQWRQEIQKLLRRQRICQVCQARVMQSELEDTIRRCTETHSKEEARFQKEQDAALQRSTVFDEIRATCVLAFKGPPQKTCHPCTSTHHTLIFPEFEVFLPHTKQAALRAEICQGFCEGDQLDIASTELVPSHLARVALGRKKGQECVVLEDVETKLHLGILQTCPPHQTGMSPSLRGVCSDDVEASLHAFIQALCFVTTSTTPGTRTVSITLDAEITTAQGGSAFVEKELRIDVVVTENMFGVLDTVAYPVKASRAPAICQDIVLQAPSCICEGDRFDGEVTLEVNCCSGWKQDGCVFGFGLPLDVAHQEETKKRRGAPIKEGSGHSTPYTCAEARSLFFEGKKVASVTAGELNDKSSLGVITITFLANPSVATVKEVVGRIWMEATEEDQRPKTFLVTLLGTMPRGRGAWCTTATVDVNMLVSDPRCKLHLPSGSCSYRLQQTSAPQAIWLPIFSNARVLSQRAATNLNLSFFDYEEFFQGGHIETLIIGGSKKGDELSLILDLPGVAINDKGTLTRKGTPIASLETQGLLGAKCVRICFEKNACMSLSFVTRLLRSICYRNLGGDSMGTRCVGVYATLGGYTLEGQLSVVVNPPIIACPAVNLCQLQVGTPVCLAGEEKDELISDETTNLSDLRLHFTLPDATEQDLFEVSRGREDFVFRAACRDELIMEDEITLTDWDTAEWHEVRGIVFARRDECIALAFSRPGELCIRFRHDSSGAPLRSMGQSRGARSSTSSTLSSASMFSVSSKKLGATPAKGLGGQKQSIAPPSPTSSQGRAAPSLKGKPRDMRGKSTSSPGGGFQEEVQATLRNVFLTCDADMRSAMRTVVITATDALGGVTRIERSLQTFPQPVPCIQLQELFKLRHKCFQHSPEMWEEMKKCTPEQSHKQVVCFGQGAKFCNDDVSNTGTWKLMAEVVSGKDTHDRLMLLCENSNLDVSEDNTVSYKGVAFARMHSRSTLLLEFFATALWTHVQAIVNNLAFSVTQEPLLEGQRKISVVFQQNDVRHFSQHVLVNVMDPLIGGQCEISLVYGLGSGHCTFMRRLKLGVTEEESVAGGAVHVFFSSPPSVCDEVGLMNDPYTWFTDAHNCIYSGERKVGKVTQTAQSLSVTFGKDAVGGDVKNVLMRLYFAHWSNCPARHSRQLLVQVSDGSSMQSVKVVVSIQKSQESLAVVLRYTEMDFVLKGMPLRIALDARVIFAGGEKLPGQSCLLVTLLQGATQFDALSVDLPPHKGSDPREHPMRLCDRGNLWWYESSCDVRIGCVEKEKKGFKGLNIKLDSPSCRALEKLFNAVAFVCTRPNLKDRGSKRDIQLVLRPGTSALGTIRPVRQTLTVKLVGPLLDESACFPRKYCGAPLVLLPHILVSRDCFRTGRLDVGFTDLNATLQTLPYDVVLLRLGEEAEAAGLTIPAGSSEVRNPSGAVVATFEGNQTHTFTLLFEGAAPQEACALLRSVQYFFTGPDATHEANHYVSVAVDMRLTDHHGNVCGGVVKVDS